MSNENVIFQINSKQQDGQGMQQLHVQEILPSGLSGQLEAGLDRPEEGRDREEQTGIIIVNGPFLYLLFSAFKAYPSSASTFLFTISSVIDIQKHF